MGGPVQDRLCRQAWRHAPGDAGRDPHPERLEHLAPPEVLPMKQGLVPVKVSARDTLSRNNEWGCTRPGVSGVPPSGLGASLPRLSGST